MTGRLVLARVPITTMHVVAASDHQIAERMLSSAIIDDHAPVYVIKMTGGPFTSIHRPREVPAPQGNVLTVTVDAATHRVTDIGFVDVEPALNQMGPVAVDLATPRGAFRRTANKSRP